MRALGYCSTAASNAFCDRAAREKWQTTAFDADQTQCRRWVKIGGKGTSAIRLVVPNEQTLVGVGGRSLQCQLRTHAPQQNSRHSVTSSARARSVDGIQCAENSDRYCTTARQRVRKPRCPNELIRPALAARGVELKKMAPVEITGAESCPGGNHVCRLWCCPPPRLDPTMPTMHDSPLRCLWL